MLRDALDLSMALRVVHRHAVPHGVGHVNRAPIGRDSRFVRMGSTGATFSDGHFLRLAACHVDELNAVLVLVQHNQSVLCHLLPSPHLPSYKTHCAQPAKSATFRILTLRRTLKRLDLKPPAVHSGHGHRQELERSLRQVPPGHPVAGTSCPTRCHSNTRLGQTGPCSVTTGPALTYKAAGCAAIHT